MGAGCSREKAAATSQSPPVEHVKPEHPNKNSTPVLTGTESQPPAASAPSKGDLEDDVQPKTPEKKDNTARLEALQRCFEALDKDKSGSIDFKELKHYLFKTGVNTAHIAGKAEELMRKMDLNQDQLVSLEEFTNMMEALLADKSDEDLDVWVAEVVYTATSRNVVGFGNSLSTVLSGLDFSQDEVTQISHVFRVLDRDHSGFVELPELKLLLGKSGVDIDAMGSAEVVTIMAKLDKNGDNKISEQELFVTLSAVRKCLSTSEEFIALLNSVVAAAESPEAAAEKPALTEVLLAEDV